MLYKKLPIENRVLLPIKNGVLKIADREQNRELTDEIIKFHYPMKNHILKIVEQVYTLKITDRDLTIKYHAFTFLIKHFSGVSALF